MSVDGNRLAQVFIWKEGSAPDLRYARQILSVVNPEAARAIDWDNPPVHLFPVEPPWPGDQWARAISDLQTISYRAGGPNLTDTTRFDLAGWQGTDQRTGDHIFVVIAYRRAVIDVDAPAPAADFQGQGLPAPSRSGQRTPQPPVPQVPYYPQTPTGPIAWPPSEQPVQESYVYSPLLGGAMSTSGDMAATVAAHSAFLESYRPFYVGFGPRLSAGLIDFFFMSLLQIITIVIALVTAPPEPPADFAAWLGRYGSLALLAILVFGAYHVVQWSMGGQTIGKKLMGIKVVGADGNPPGWGRSVLRFVGYIFSISLGGWGVVMVALDLRHQGLHDKIAETFVVPEKAQVPAPAGLPGYTGFSAPTAARPPRQDIAPQPTAGQLPALGMANLAGDTSYNPIQISMSEASRNEAATPADRAAGTTQQGQAQQPGRSPASIHDIGETTIPNLADVLNSGPLQEGIVSQTAARTAASAQNEQAAANTVRARTLFKEGLTQMEGGVLPTSRGYNVGPGPARAAANLFRQAVELVPTSVVYRYFYAIALRYSEGFEVAIPELRRVLEQDPTHYEARQQVAYGPRWHDAFAYPAWVSPAPVNANETLPAAIRGLLPPGQQPATRLVLLREGGTKIAAFLSRTPRRDWTNLPTPEMEARLSLFLSRTPYGPILALYIVVDDGAENPYIGETFLNPHDPGQPHEDACQLGQNMLEQIARQDRTYLIFADEQDRLLLSRRLVFDAATQVSTARMLYEVQSLPPQVMDQERFRQAAQWHMEHFPLDQVKG
ncbi:MAG: RDD family protein [Chloroflexota bacterium]|nr:RDD family protein [Chloroflexota bacterium]MDQ5865833.1 RDD family protein [Chloroflexota bacterium]